MRKALTLLVGLLSASGSVSCDDEKRAEALREAEKIAHAVKALREAEGDAKRPRLAELRSLSCNAPDVCELRDECVEAYRLYLEGYDATSAVRRSLKADSGTDPASAALLLEKAERNVKLGKQRAARCADLEGAVRRSYGVGR